MVTSDKPSFGLKALYVFAGIGILLIIVRFAFGLGSITNLSDGYPWGVWIGFDILAGIALAAGGFVMAGTVHLFGGRKFHVLARPAILTAFLGYLLFIFGLVIDLGRPWNLWRAIYSWNHASPMFEVAWCVMLYTTVLLLEFLPVVFEYLGLHRLHAQWHEFVPWIIIFMLGIFTLAMTYSFVWMIAVVLILLIWEIFMRRGTMPRDKMMPILLIMAGVIFSTLHQSSLGSLFLIVSHKMHALWYTPLLPLQFLVSAIMVAPAMVILESLLSERMIGVKSHFTLLTSLAKALPFLLSLYLILRLADLVARQNTMDVFQLNMLAVSWWAEIIIGIILPLILFLTPEIRNTPRGLLWSAVLVVTGLIWNRINVAVVGFRVRSWETYTPRWSEILITVGIVALGLLVFRWVVRNMPIYQEHETAAIPSDS